MSISDPFAMKSFERRDDIDGLRALAVLSVLIFHAFGDVLRGGFMGVDVFFVISGFVITQLIVREFEAGSFSYLEFYARRIRRLYPALLLVLICVLGAGWFILFADEYENLSKVAFSSFFYLNNFVNALEIDYFKVDAENYPLTHLWSLAVEEQFYLLWPLALIFMLKRRLNIKRILPLVMGFSFLSGLVLLKINHNYAFYLPFSRAFELLAGAYLVFLPSKQNKNLFNIGLFLVGVSLVFIEGGRDFPGLKVLPLVFGTCLMLHFGQGNRFFSHKFMVSIGLISYPLYLWHWPLFSFQYITQGQQIELWLRVSMIALTFVLASLTYLFIEKPMRNTKLLPSAVKIYLAMASLSALSLFIYTQHGLHSRPVAAKENPQFTKLNNEFHTQKTQFLGCYKAFNRLNPPFECLFNAKENPVLLIGDSTANALYPPLLEAVPSLQLMWQASCFPFRVQDDKGILRPEYAQCAPFNAAIERYLASNSQPLIIHTRVPFKYKQEVLNEDEKEQAKKRGLHVADKFDFAFYASLQEFLKGLNGKNIIFVLSPPIFEKQAKLCLMRPLQRTKPQSCTLSLEEHEQNYATYRANLSALSQHNQNIKFVPVELFFCDENSCAIANKHKLLYADDVHLTPSGLQPLVKAIKNILNDTLQTK